MLQVNFWVNTSGGGGSGGGKSGGGGSGGSKGSGGNSGSKGGNSGSKGGNSGGNKGNSGGKSNVNNGQDKSQKSDKVSKKPLNKNLSKEDREKKKQQSKEKKGYRQKGKYNNKGKHLGWYKNGKIPGEQTGEHVDVTYYLNDVSDPLTQVMMTYGEDGNYDAAYTYGLERIEVEDLDETRPESQDPLYYLYDGLGSVTYMVKPDGNIRDHYNFDEYGKPAPGNSKQSPDGAINLNNTFGYTGEMWDEESNLLYLRARYYEPETGRFLSRDTYEGELGNPLSRNLYAYVGNNPLNRIDPSGHRWLDHSIDIGDQTYKNDVWTLCNVRPDIAQRNFDYYETWYLQYNLKQWGYRDYQGLALKTDGIYGKRTLSAHFKWWFANNAHYPQISSVKQGTSQNKIPGTAIFSQSGNINTFSHHVSNVRGVPANLVYVRKADYYAISETHGPSTNTYYYNNWDGSYFWAKGYTSPGLSGSIRAGYLVNEPKSPEEVTQFLKGLGFGASAGFGGGVGISVSTSGEKAIEVLYHSERQY